MPRRRKGNRLARVQWTNRGKNDGRVRVEKAAKGSLNTRHRERGRQDTADVKAGHKPIMGENPGVSVKLPRHINTQELTAETKRWAGNMRIGQAYRLRVPMEYAESLSTDYPYQIAQEHTPRAWDKNYDPKAESIASAGALVIYLGPQRIDERAGDGRVLRETKHLFVIGSGRYVVLDLNNLEPLK